MEQLDKETKQANNLSHLISRLADIEEMLQKELAETRLIEAEKIRKLEEKKQKEEERQAKLKEKKEAKKEKEKETKKTTKKKKTKKK